jgi:hypothetical protein
MKATINGVPVEGTPQEIAEYMRLVGTHSIAIKTPDIRKSKDDGMIPFKPNIYCGGTAPISTF